jgi:hypothetical protein
MHEGDSRVSHNNTYKLILQTDGNFVLYDKTPAAVAPGRERPYPDWSSHTDGRAVDRVVMQTDGNLVMFPPSSDCFSAPCNGRPKAVWQSGTRGHPSSHLRIQDNGHAVIYDGSSNDIWDVHGP